MKNLNFTKMQWIWNDFVIIKNIELEEKGIELTTNFIKRICNRNFWIGSDWLIVVGKWIKTEFKFTMYNSDWTEAEISWNGMGCYIKYLNDKKLTKKLIINVETLSNILKLELYEDVFIVTIWIPKIISEFTYRTKSLWDSFLMKIDERVFKFTPISMWNPHCVIFLKNWELVNFELEKYGKHIENNIEIFPNKTNVEFMEIISNLEINIKTWWRWIWEALASWSWACASVVAWILAWKLEKDEFIKVNLSGGILEIKWSWNKKDSVIMKWKAETTFEGVYFIKK